MNNELEQYINQEIAAQNAYADKLYDDLDLDCNQGAEAIYLKTQYDGGGY